MLSQCGLMSTPVQAKSIPGKRLMPKARKTKVKTKKKNLKI